MTFCPSCGHQGPDGSRFCPACGAATSPGGWPVQTMTAPPPSPATPPKRGLGRIPMWARVVIIIVLLVGVGPIVLFVRGFMNGFNGAINGNLSGSETAQQIETDLRTRLGTDVTVTCPDMTIGKGRIGDCTATSPGESSYVVRVTQDDDQGHYTWQLTSQIAP